MANETCFAVIRPTDTTATTFNIRNGPGTGYAVLFAAPVSQAILTILEVKRDEGGTSTNSKVHQWFNVRFPDNRTGWIRDDGVAIYGDCAAYGYGLVAFSAFALTRSESSQPTDPNPTPPPTDIKRIQKAAYAITGAFEGSGYAAFNNYDAGIVSYGLFQFTLASSSLETVLRRYWALSTGRVADSLKAYEQAVVRKDQALRSDERFKNLLIKAAEEKEMREAQNAVATEKYWDAVYVGYVQPRELKLPLTLALLFDMGINFGPNHSFVRLAEQQLGVPSRSKPGQNGITEEQLTKRVAELRRDSHYKQAAAQNLPGLRVRGDFWLSLCTRGDWNLQGDNNGNVNVNGRIVQVRNP